jgi:hypothetical protein
MLSHYARGQSRINIALYPEIHSQPSLARFAIFHPFLTPDNNLQHAPAQACYNKASKPPLRRSAGSRAQLQQLLFW